ncbi:hypothetical protein MPTK1_1g00160 [Marchantia polymorpha subsp. ruderalis]|uniref:Plastid lipid-associated protein/fibrillin conserved domain-containing protein n=2 Tax=Marchantia polymorpha TaxID=3197 RepID=A0AAF6AJV5_MARPO|nr:hypothetical protein MARPO_0103s0070 [Marchantia polymorpha]BBM96725.1 hypothetical protein Mp_1g00160 [Marchantia polymorpha subsp. ruderalis]|eukprot:PTQ32104.1 hypothetical protein MARPO_0103s0070 [Marchantia polymorpha]
MSAFVAVQLVGFPLCSTSSSSSSSRPSALAASGGFSASRNFRVKGDEASTSFSNAVSFVGDLKVVQPTIGGRNVALSVSSAALFPFLRGKKKDVEKVKIELLDAIAPLDRGANASPDDLARVDLICQELEKLNPSKAPLKSPLVNGKWKLIYTTSESILKKSRPGLLRPNGPIYQAINTDTLRAQNMETWPYFNQVTANLVPIDSRKVLVKFDYFKLFGLSIISIGKVTGVTSRIPHLFSKSLSLAELCLPSHTTVGNAGPVKVSDCGGFESEDWKNPCYFLVKTRLPYSDKPELKWCGLCGNREGWMRCGSCMGEGGYVTKPGLAGVKGRVGWSRCKTCYGKRILPCLLCAPKTDDRQPK